MMGKSSLQKFLWNSTHGSASLTMTKLKFLFGKVSTPLDLNRLERSREVSYEKIDYLMVSVAEPLLHKVTNQPMKMMRPRFSLRRAKDNK
jgi:hypothetical protein